MNTVGFSSPGCFCFLLLHRFRPCWCSRSILPSYYFTWIFWLLPRKQQVTQPGVLDLHTAKGERARRTEGSDDSSEGSYTISYSIYLYSWLDDSFYHKINSSSFHQPFTLVTRTPLKLPWISIHGYNRGETIVYNRWWYNRSNNISQIQDLSPDRC